MRHNLSVSHGAAALRVVARSAAPTFAPRRVAADSQKKQAYNHDGPTNRIKPRVKRLPATSTNPDGTARTRGFGATGTVELYGHWPDDTIPAAIAAATRWDEWTGEAVFASGRKLTRCGCDVINGPTDASYRDWRSGNKSDGVSQERYASAVLNVAADAVGLKGVPSAGLRSRNFHSNDVEDVDARAAMLIAEHYFLRALDHPDDATNLGKGKTLRDKPRFKSLINGVLLSDRGEADLVGLFETPGSVDIADVQKKLAHAMNSLEVSAFPLADGTAGVLADGAHIRFLAEATDDSRLWLLKVGQLGLSVAHFRNVSLVRGERDAGNADGMQEMVFLFLGKSASEAADLEVRKAIEARLTSAKLPDAPDVESPNHRAGLAIAQDVLCTLQQRLVVVHTDSTVPSVRLLLLSSNAAKAKIWQAIGEVKETIGEVKETMATKEDMKNLATKNDIMIMQANIMMAALLVTIALMVTRPS